MSTPTQAAAAAGESLPNESAPPLPSPRAVFLCFYSLFMAGEKRREEEVIEKGEDSGAVVVNRELRTLRLQLSALYGDGDVADGNGDGVGCDGENRGSRAPCRLDGCGLYLYALVLDACRQAAAARAALVASVRRTPCNWSAWQVGATPLSSFDCPHFVTL